MIDAIYLAQIDKSIPVAIEKKTTAIQQSGLIHSKVAGRFEVVKTLPKETDSFDNMFNYADAFGTFKLAYINSAHKISAKPNKTKKDAFAIGGEFGLNSAEFNGLSFHITTYFSQHVNSLNPDKNNLNEDFFTTNRDSFAYISEASIDYNSDFFQSKVGRVKVETPYANSDDIRMAPNTFEGAWAEINYTSKLKTQLIYLNRWAGYDSQDEDSGLSQDEFKELVGNDSFGMFGVSISYEYAKNSEVSFWYNYIDEVAKITYGEIVGIYFIDGDYIHLDYGFQASSIKELANSNVDGNVFGAMSILHYNNTFFGGSYNVSSSDKGKFITNGFGGGPYYTSLDEATIESISQAAAFSPKTVSKNKNESYRVGGGYEFKGAALDGMVIELVYGKLYNDNGSIKEKDLIFTYEMNDKWNFMATYTNYNSTCDNNTFDRTLVKLNYIF